MWKQPRIWLGAAFFALGMLLNFLSETYIPLRTAAGIPHAYVGSSFNLFFPIIAFCFSLLGIALVGLAVRAKVIRNRAKTLSLILLIALVLTAFYAAFYLGMQFLATGADRLGECNGLIQAANSSHDVPDSVAVPGKPAVGCAVERYGILLSFYNDVSVSGVTDRAAQDRVLQGLSDYRKRARTHPMHVVFYERENWLSVRGEKGTLGKRGPERMIRVATLG